MQGNIDLVADVEGAPELMKETFPLSRAMLLAETKHARILETEECHGFASTLYLLHRVGFDC